MRPLALDPRHLRRILRDLESSLDEVTTATTRVDPPTQGFPWHGLVERGVAALMGRTAELVEACHRVVGGLEDSVHDVEVLDEHVADAARRHR